LCRRRARGHDLSSPSPFGRSCTTGFTSSRIEQNAATILAATHEWIPMVTLDERRELQLANAEAD
jgi:hypothetical protein